MTCDAFTKSIWLLTGLLLAITLVPLIASPAASGLAYDASKEVTLSGTVSSVLTEPAPGMIMGSHLIIETNSGKVDASLGRWGLRSTPAVTPGQQIQVTGVMKTLNEKKVFLVRTIEANGNSYTIRNVHGIEISPQSHERAAQRGESQ